MEGLLHLFWLVVFIAIGFPVALGIELYLRASRRSAKPAVRRRDASIVVPQNTGRILEPARAALSGEIE